MSGNVIHQPVLFSLYKSRLYKENGAQVRFRVQAWQKQHEIWRTPEYLITKTGIERDSIVQARLVQRERAYFLLLEDERGDKLDVDRIADDDRSRFMELPAWRD